jgi:hypothetical protein
MNPVPDLDPGYDDQRLKVLESKQNAMDPPQKNYNILILRGLHEVFLSNNGNL